MYKIVALTCFCCLFACFGCSFKSYDDSPRSSPPEWFTSINIEEGVKGPDYAELAESIVEGDTYSRVLEVMGNPVNKYITSPKRSSPCSYLLEYCVEAENVYHMRYILFYFDKGGILYHTYEPDLEYTEDMQRSAKDISNV